MAPRLSSRSAMSSLALPYRPARSGAIALRTMSLMRFEMAGLRSRGGVIRSVRNSRSIWPGAGAS
jgi:hypothetical protein